MTPSPGSRPGGGPGALAAAVCLIGAAAVLVAAALGAGGWVVAAIAVAMLAVPAALLALWLGGSAAGRAGARGAAGRERYDELTRLPTAIQLRADLEARRRQAGTEERLTLVLFSLEGLKKYNDSYGHACGDALIAWLARKLTDAVGSRAGVYRLRGGDFAVVLDTPSHVVEEAIRAADASLSEIGEGFVIWSSFGAAVLPAEADTVSEALKLADRRTHAYRSSPYAGPRAGHDPDMPDDPLEVLRFVRPRYDVAELAVAVGRRMGLAGSELEQLEVGAQLRDVGNMAIPAAVLAHPGELSDSEWRFVRLHTLVGERLLAANFGMEEVAALVRSSHERWDGGGYPDGLAGEAIPLGSRIVFVCSAFQDMTSDRSYRDALSAEQALDELDAGALTQFDPRVVAAFREEFDSAQERTASSPGGDGKRSLRVLVAEDDAAARFLLRRAIEENGHECLPAEDGARAWELFLQHRPEVVVSDWLMPRVDGDELCRRIRADHDAPYTYFVMLTALEYKAHVLRAMQAGVDDFLTKPLDRHELQMRLIAAERVTALHRRLTEQQQAIQAEVDLAAMVQRGLLPAAPPAVDGVQLEGMCIPATSVSGDYYDYLVDASGRLVLIVADVAGHSISSALVMAGARAIVRRETARASGPAELLALTNRTMYEDLVSAELFITAFCACYQPETRRLCFAGAGHNPPLLRRADGTVEALEPDGAAIGLLEEAEYEEQSLVLEPGDLVLLYTDGAVEAAGARQRQFGQERLHSVLAGWTGGSARDLVEEVLLEIRAHTGEQPQRDDITMLAMRVV